MNPHNIANMLTEDIEPGEMGVLSEDEVGFKYKVTTRGGLGQDAREDMEHLQSELSKDPENPEIQAEIEGIKDDYAYPGTEIMCNDIYEDDEKGLLWIGIGGPSIKKQPSGHLASPPGWKVFDNSEFNERFKPKIDARMREIVEEYKARPKEPEPEPEPEDLQFLPDTDRWRQRHSPWEWSAQRYAKRMGMSADEFDEGLVTALDSDEQLRRLRASAPRRAKLTKKFTTILTVKSENVVNIERLGPDQGPIEDPRPVEPEPEPVV